MNYRHIFHAGNFADVMKHAILARILVYLARKDAPFRVIDTHAGEGAYDLGREEATKTGEWRNGIGRLASIDPESPAGRLLAPYRDAVGPCDAEGRPLRYPGSPALVQALMRAQDRAVFCETQPSVRDALIAALGRDGRIKCPDFDGWSALKAFVPPPERRGLVLVDPPFEAPDEFDRMADAFVMAWRKWPTGVYALWYPVKDVAARQHFLTLMQGLQPRNTLQLELVIAPPSADAGLTRAGMIVVNSPYSLEGEAKIILPALVRAMGRRGAGGGDWRVRSFGSD